MKGDEDELVDDLYYKYLSKSPHSKEIYRLLQKDIKNALIRSIPFSFKNKKIDYNMIWDILFFELYAGNSRINPSREFLDYFPKTLLFYFKEFLRVFLSLFIRDMKLHDNSILLLAPNYNDSKALEPLIKPLLKNKFPILIYSVYDIFKGKHPYKKKSENISILSASNIIAYNQFIDVFKYIYFHYCLYKKLKKNIMPLDEKHINISFIRYTIPFLVIKSLLHYDNSRRLLEKCSPNIILLSNDHSLAHRAMVYASKEKKIITMHYPHSVMFNGWVYMNIISDKIFVRGNIEKQNLISLGYKNENVKVIGKKHPELNNKHNNIITVYTTSGGHSLDKKLSQVVMMLYEKFDQYKLNIQLHPGEKLSQYDNIGRLINNGCLSSLYANSEEALMQSFINIAPINSNKCLNSIFHLKLTIAYNFIDARFTPLPYAEYNSLIIANNLADIEKSIVKIITNKNFVQMQINNARIMRKDYFEDIDTEESINLVMAEINKAI